MKSENSSQNTVTLPWPILLTNRAIELYRYPAILFGSIVAGTMMVWFAITDSLYPVDIAPWDDLPLEITGVLTMLSVMSGYIAMCIVATTRLANRVFHQLSKQFETQIGQPSTRYKSAKYWLLALVICEIYGMGFNLGWESFGFSFDDPRFWVSVNLVTGQLIMWFLISIVLFFGVSDSIILHRSAKQVEVDLYDLDALNGFGSVALNSFLILVGASAITTIQSIDRDFGIERYFNAAIVLIPAILIMVPLPIWAIHRKIRTAKSKSIEEIDAEIRLASRTLNDESLHRMNGLMLRRDHIHKLRNWPMDLSIVSRFVLYVFIPPLAWAGAAFMEFYLDGVLGG